MNYEYDPMSEYLKQNQEYFFREALIPCLYTYYFIDTKSLTLILNSYVSHQGPCRKDTSSSASSAYEDIIEIKNLLKNNLKFHDMKFLQNEVDVDEEDIDKSSEDHKFNDRRGFYSSAPYKPSYVYEPPAYHPPPAPPPYKAVYEVSRSYRLPSFFNTCSMNRFIYS